MDGARRRDLMAMLAIGLFALTTSAAGLTPPPQHYMPSRRRLLLGSAAAALLPPVAAASAAVDCLQDCLQNCARLAGGSIGYCKTSCNEYCDQDDRRDGLSGSISSEGAEFGWASAFKNPLAPQKPVVYGTDRPPGLPDVFGVNQALRKAVTGGDLTGGVEGQGGVRD